LSYFKSTCEPCFFSSGGHGTRTDSVNACGSNGLRQPENQFGTETGTLQANSGPIPPDLQVVIDAWPTLPEAIRADIVAMVRTAGGDTAEDWPPVPTSGGCTPSEAGCM